MQNELNFKDFNFSPEIEKGILEAGFTIPSPIQSKAIPFIMDGSDIIGQAHTGTGKTAAFALPILEKIDTREKAQALIITPTRELATQVGDEVFKLGRFKNIKTVTIYGGQSYSRQIGFLEKGAHVVVATPGRLLDLLKSGKIDLNPRFVVLDEADEMLDMGFLDNIKEIFEFLPSSRQTLLFSATMPNPIKNLAKKILNEPKFVSIASTQATNKNIEQFYYVIEEHERDNAIIRILDTLPNQKSIVFCRMKKEVDRVAQALMSAGYKATGLHGDMEQRQRETTIKGFKEDVYEILVATDVAARGIDVNGVTHVFNYHIPFDPESYVHRIGRTARGGNSGTAITLVTPLEFRELERIESKIGTEIKVDYVPSMNDVQNINDKKIIELIRTQEIKTDSMEMLNLLKEEMDITHICLKLLSMVSKDKKTAGPDKIGFDSGALKALLQRRAKKDDDRRKSQGFGNRGGSRGRSGGGYGNSDRNRGGGGYGNSDRNRSGGGYGGGSSSGERSGGYGSSSSEDRNRGGGSGSGERSGGYGSSGGSGSDRNRGGGYGGSDRNRGGGSGNRSGGYGGGSSGSGERSGGSDRGGSDRGSGNRR